MKKIIRFWINTYYITLYNHKRNGIEGLHCPYFVNKLQMIMKINIDSLVLVVSRVENKFHLYLSKLRTTTEKGVINTIKKEFRNINDAETS